MLPSMYRTADGQEVPVPHEQAWRLAIRFGHVTASTLVMVPGRTDWVPAGSLPDFAAWCAQAGLGDAPAPAPSVPAAPAPGRRRRWVSLVAVCGLVLLALGALGAQRWFSQPSSEAVVAREMGDTIRAILNGEPLPPAGAVPAGEHQIFLDWFRTYLGRAQQINTDMQAALTSNRADTLLAPQTMATPEALADALSRARELTRVIADLQARHIKLLEEAAAEIDALELPPMVKAEVKRGINESLPANLTRLKSYYQIELEFLAETTDLLAFMQTAQRQAGYTVTGDQIMFNAESDLSEYNRRIGNLREIARREAEVQAAMRSNLESSLNRLEQYK